MFGLSTAWKSKKCDNGMELLKKIQEAEVRGIELEYRITVNMFNQMKDALKKSSMTVLSIHNFFPHPEILPRSKASGNVLYLSAIDMDERKLAIKYACRSIQYAHDLEVGTVIFHLGKVDIERDREKWFQLYDEGKLNTSLGREFIENKLRLRLAKRDKNLDAVLFSLDQINEEAMRLNVRIGIENRYYWNEIPDFDEIGLLLQKFEGSNIGYWHDCGHAHTSENFGLATHEQFLQNYSNKLIGIHLHDCKGYKDHIAPGYGNIDFDMIKNYLQNNTIKIIEIHNKVTLSELKQGIAYLRDKEIL